ncbi:MAG: hypothetical protein U1E27_11275, partial [Kiritimatiellia bacterium]|nr:hypothetical protein [Kiritimatiellia bacterium]
LDRGRLILSDSTENLRRLRDGSIRIFFEIEAPETELREQIAAIGAFPDPDLRVLEDGWRTGSFTWNGAEDPRPEFFRLAARRGWTLREIRRERNSLEDIFVSLTTRETAGGGA